jgi:hypothetical protein
MKRTSDKGCNTPFKKQKWLEVLNNSLAFTFIYYINKVVVAELH